MKLLLQRHEPLAGLEISAMDLSKYPRQYWHCHASLHADGKHDTINEEYQCDMNIQTIIEQIVIPWVECREFAVAGLLIKNQNSIKRIQIIQTEKDSHYYHEIYLNHMRQIFSLFTAASRRVAPFREDSGCIDYTYKLLHETRLNHSRSHGGNSISPALTRSHLRKMLREILKTDSAISAFCLDHFEGVHANFVNGMDLTSKLSLLLQEDLDAVYLTLRNEHPTAVEDYENKS